MPTVAVIMSTYNGEKFLAEQLDSILAQDGVHVELYIRDDGSKDNTREILSSYAEKYANIHLDFGENMGYAKSFITELRAASGCGYYAFSDQDDYWKPEKLYAAVTAIKAEEAKHGTNTTVMYYSNLYVSDSNLNVIYKTKKEHRIKTLEGITLRRNIISGSTIVMNARLREVVVSMPEVVGGHDSFVLSLCIFTKGIAVFDANTYTFYRQHGNNTSGSPIKLSHRIKREWHRLLHDDGFEAKRAQAYLKYWREDFDPAAKKTMTVVAGYRKNLLYRLEMLFSPKYRTGDWRLTLMGKVKILLGQL